MKNPFLLFFLLTLFIPALNAQIVSLDPFDAGPDDAATLIFDASQGNGELTGADKVYLHHGVVTDAPDGFDWQYVIGNWGADDGVGEMIPVPGESDKWQISFEPSIREYFGVPSTENIFRISAVFRSADGNTKGTIAPGTYGWGEVAANGDIYINLNAGSFVTMTAPATGESFLDPGDEITFEAVASSEVTNMTMEIDSGNGYDLVATVNAGTTIDYTYEPATTGDISIRITATINGEEVELVKSHYAIVLQPTSVAALPAGVIPGINYDENDDTKATLVLQAPGKEFAYVVGDFTNWQVQDNYQMLQTPDGEYFWVEIDGLTPQQAYVFQYWVETDVKIGDPYATQVADPWNDEWIEETTYPDLPEYTYTEYQTATVLQTAPEEYQWAASEDNWERPDLNHLVIYELLVRDFLATHSWTELKDTLAYIRNLGVDAIEVMPFNEFEGNESWGYNPSYYFAPDKYYGTPEQLKQFIEACHQEGLAVIMDMVLNHAYGQCALVKLYWDQQTGNPAADNPWFNTQHVGPFAWGYDFDHESEYTKAFMDRVNAYWIEEFHVDGYRFDFTKGFTNYAPGGNIDGYDQSRIDILKRMADEIWDVDPEAYVILEHWGPWAEEQELANYGMKMWRNRSYDYVPPVNGSPTNNFDGMDATSHVSYFDSHDEQRIAWHALTEGLTNGGYNVKDPLIMYERAKLAAAFCFLIPGPKMMWQFDELGYDIDINFNGRVGNKPLPWGTDGLGYYEDPLRRYIYDAYQGILDVRRQIGPVNMTNANTNHELWGDTRRLVYDTPENDLVVVGNFGLTTQTQDPQFTQTGTWYDYFSGEEIDVTNVTAPIELKAGEWHVYTTEQLSNGLPGVVEVYDNPVTISPYPFTQSDEITLTFDAAKAWPGQTDGLVGADKVYFHSGVILEHPDSTAFENVVGNLIDDGVGEMTEVSEDLWQITLTAKEYYSLTADEEPYKLGMYFRDGDNQNLGFGFRDSEIFFAVESERPFVTIDPPAFDINDEITITFNARRGNRELVGADKVYMHSSVDLTDTETPHNSAWENVVGNWGADDGVGEMTELPDDPDMWQITLTPIDYYGLEAGDIAYWLAAVFRSADGNVKGTGTPGEIENGYIHTNLDFFIRNEIIINTEEPDEAEGLHLFPNPVRTSLYIDLESWTPETYYRLVNSSGQVLEHEVLPGPQTELTLRQLPAGIYLLEIENAEKRWVRKLIVQ